MAKAVSRKHHAVILFTTGSLWRQISFMVDFAHLSKCVYFTGQENLADMKLRSESKWDDLRNHVAEWTIKGYPSKQWINE